MRGGIIGSCVLLGTATLFGALGCSADEAATAAGSRDASVEPGKPNGSGARASAGSGGAGGNGTTTGGAGGIGGSAAAAGTGGRTGDAATGGTRTTDASANGGRRSDASTDSSIDASPDARVVGHDVYVPSPDGGLPITSAQRICSANEWCWYNPLPQGNDLNGLWAFSPNDVWAIGAHGTALHWDGQAWGGVTGNWLDFFYDVWGAAPNDVWVADAGGPTRHWDGVRFGPIASAPQNMTAVHGTSASDVWEVGSSGQVAHFDGRNWESSLDSGLVFPRDLEKLWVASPSSAWAGGPNSAFTHWDGRAWTDARQSSIGAVLGMWGASPSDIWLLSDTYIDRYNGQTWSVVPNVPSGPWIGLHGSSATNLWLFGYRKATRYDGQNWIPISGSIPCSTDAGFTFGATNTWVAGGLGCVAQWNGAAWSKIPGVSSIGGGFQDMWGSAANDIWAIGTGASGGGAAHFDGSQWTHQDIGTTNWFKAIWGSSKTNIWAATWNGELAHYDGTWTMTGTIPTSLGQAKRIWGRSASDVWLVGECGVIHYDGQNWGPPSVRVCSQITAVGGSSAGELWASGVNGSVYKWNTDHFDVLATPSDFQMNDILVLSPTDAWMAGSAGMAYHWDGLSWTRVLTHGVTTFQRLFSLGPKNVWAVGGVGGVGHWDGTAWTAHESGYDNSVTGIWGAIATDMWIVGDGGEILRRQSSAP